MGEEGWGLHWRPRLWHEGVWAERPVSFQDLSINIPLISTASMFLGQISHPQNPRPIPHCNARGEREISLNCLRFLCWLF